VGEDSLVSGHHVLGGWLSELDLPDGILKRGQLLARTTCHGLTVLTVGSLSEFHLLPVRILIDEYVGHAHCGGGDVGIGTLSGLWCWFF
jgi:hypothetical protein